jgi:integrase
MSSASLEKSRPQVPRKSAKIARRLRLLQRFLSKYIEAAERYGHLEGLFLRLLVTTGCDVGELFRVQALDVELEREGKTPRIQYQRTKTGTRPRWVPLTPTLVTLLNQHMSEHGLTKEATLFNDEKTFSRAAIDNPSLRVKDLRHIAAITWRRGGLSIADIRDYLGHSTILQTMVYAEYGEDPDRDKHALMKMTAFAG